MAIRVISSLRRKERTTKPTALGGRCEEKAWSRWAAGSELPLEQITPAARRVRRRFRLAVRRVCHCLPEAATRYAIFPKAHNTAGVTFATDC